MSDKWFGILTDPLGFAGFALFLIASLLTRVKSKGFFDSRTKAGINRPSLCDWGLYPCLCSKWGQ